MANCPKIFVIIVTYKGHLWYERCFTSLRQSDSLVQTVVIDNASNDGTVEYIRAHFPEIHLIESKENLGFGRANNMGMRYALDNGADYVFLLNQDAWVEPNTIGELIRLAEKYPEYGILSPMHLQADKENLEEGFLNYISNNQITDSMLFQDLYFGKLKEIYSSKYINAAGWLLPRRTIEKIGGFDPIFFHYEEDDDYINRVLFHKLKIGVAPYAKMVHDHRKSNNTDENSSIRHKQFLLVRFTNLNNNESLSSFLLYLIRKIISYILKFQWNKVVDFFSDLLFLIKTRKRIKYSRIQNKLNQTSWLYSDDDFIKKNKK